MKAVLITLLATSLSLCVAGLIVRLIARRVRSGGGRLRIFLLLAVVFFLLGGIGYFGIYYHATDHARAYLRSTETVTVRGVPSGYLFDGPGTEEALIFYPGAKVEETAYAELMSVLAEEGVDCFLVRMPLHMAFMGREKAADIMASYDYAQWYIAGHSLGGAMASLYCADHSDDFAGLALLASYSTKELPDDLQMVSIVASNDQVLRWPVYEENQKNCPDGAEEVVIEGGNHGQFGDYGEQKGDGEATITQEEQLTQTAAAILSLVDEARG